MPGVYIYIYIRMCGNFDQISFWTSRRRWGVGRLGADARGGKDHWQVNCCDCGAHRGTGHQPLFFLVQITDNINGHNHSDKYIKHIEKREYIYKWMYNTSYNNTKWIIINDNNHDDIYIQYGILTPISYQYDLVGLCIQSITTGFLRPQEARGCRTLSTQTSKIIP